jgi:hypothetical protein
MVQLKKVIFVCGFGFLCLLFYANRSEAVDFCVLPPQEMYVLTVADFKAMLENASHLGYAGTEGIDSALKAQELLLEIAGLSTSGIQNEYQNQDISFIMSALIGFTQKSVQGKKVPPLEILGKAAEYAYNQGVKHALKHYANMEAPLEVLSYAGLASIPIKIMETFWKSWVIHEKYDDINSALTYYIKNRLAYDEWRHRQDLGWEWFWDEQGILKADYRQMYDDIWVNGLLPEVGFIVRDDGNYKYFIAGEASYVNETQSIYDIWCNILRNERDGFAIKQIIQSGKQAQKSTMMVRREVETYIKQLRDRWAQCFERFYYQLYQSTLRHQICMTIFYDEAWREIVAYHNAQIGADVEEVAREFANQRERETQRQADFSQWQQTYNQSAQQAQAIVQRLPVLGDAPTQEDVDERLQVELELAQTYSQEMNDFKQKARTCKTGRASYADYVTFQREYNEESERYKEFTFSGPRSAYLETYNAIAAELREQWILNANEFKDLSEELIRLWERFRRFLDTHNQIVSETPDLFKNLDADVWRTVVNFWCPADPEVNFVYVSEYVKNWNNITHYDRVLEDLATARRRLADFQYRFTVLLEQLAIEDYSVLEIQEKARRAYDLYAELATVQGTSTTSRLSRAVNPVDFTSCSRLYQYLFDFATTLTLLEEKTDLSHFSKEDYESFYTAFSVFCDSVPPDYETLKEYLPTEFYNLTMQKLETFNRAYTAMDQTQLLLQATRNRKRWDSLSAASFFEAQLGAPIVWWNPAGLTAADGNVYATCGNDGGLKIFDFTNPLDPHEIGWSPSPGYAYDVVLHDSYAYVTSEQHGIMTVDIHDPDNPRILNVFNTNGVSQGIDVFSEKNIVIVANGENGLAAVDVSNPDRLQRFNPLPTADAALAVKTADSLVYIAEGESGLQIADYSIPQSPRILASLVLDGSAQELFLDGETLFVAAGDGGLHAVDVRNPGEPDLLGSIVLAPYAVKDLTVSGEIAYVIGVVEGTNQSALFFVNISDPETMYRIAEFYVFDGYAQNILHYDHYLLVTTGKEGNLLIGDLEKEEVIRSLAPPAQFQLEVDIVGNGKGSVTVRPPEETIRHRKEFNAPAKATVQLTAQADADNTFVGWIGDNLSWSDPYTFVIDQDTVIHAFFAAGEDSDGDHLPDAWERERFGNLDARPDEDPDFDDLISWLEFLLGADPNRADTDGDGIPDGWEYRYALNPLKDDAADDPDGDGFSNIEEYRSNTDPRDAGSTPPVSFVDPLIRCFSQ